MACGCNSSPKKAGIERENCTGFSAEASLSAGICRIVGAGEGFPSFEPLTRTQPEDLLIAADGGCRTLEELGLTPEVIVGDFDSLGYVPQGKNVQRWPVMKDDTDMMLALRLGLQRGYRTFYLYGGCGGRLDHTLANLQALAFLAQQGAVGFLFETSQTLTVLENGTALFDAFLAEQADSGLLSVFAQGGPAQGVYLKGLLYPMENGTLSPSFPLGVSNHFTEQPAEIRVEKGRLLLAWDTAMLPTLHQSCFL